MIKGLFGALTGIGPAISGLGLGVKILLAVGIFAGGAIGYGMWRDSLVREGENKAIAGIAKGNSEFIKRAQDARSKVSDCWSLNKEWDQTTGACQ